VLVRVSNIASMPFPYLNEKRRLKWMRGGVVNARRWTHLADRNLPDLAPSQRFGGCRSFIVPNHSAALDEYEIVGAIIA